MLERENPFVGHSCVNWQIAESAWEVLQGRTSPSLLMHALKDSPKVVARKVRELEQEYREMYPRATTDEVLDYIVGTLEDTDI